MHDPRVWAEFFRVICHSVIKPSTHSKDYIRLMHRLVRFIKTPRQLLLASIARVVVLLPILLLFALYFDPVSDALIYILIAIFAFSSGFINTNAYQMATNQGINKKVNGSRIANLLNVVFHLAIFLSLSIDLILMKTVVDY